MKHLGMQSCIQYQWPELYSSANHIRGHNQLHSIDLEKKHITQSRSVMKQIPLSSEKLWKQVWQDLIRMAKKWRLWSIRIQIKRYLKVKPCIIRKCIFFWVCWLWLQSQSVWYVWSMPWMKCNDCILWKLRSIQNQRYNMMAANGGHSF